MNADEVRQKCTRLAADALEQSNDGEEAVLLLALACCTVLLNAPTRDDYLAQKDKALKILEDFHWRQR